MNVFKRSVAAAAAAGVSGRGVLANLDFAAISAGEPKAAPLLAMGLILGLVSTLSVRRRPSLTRGLFTLVAPLLVFGHLAHASLITSTSAVFTPATVINFGQFAGSDTVRFTSPVTVAPGVTVSSTNPDGSLLGSGPYALDDNGVWNTTLAGLDVDQFGGDQYTMSFHFASPVSAVGGLINYASFYGSGFSDATFAALDANGLLLESWDLNTSAPISTPGSVNQGAFRGIARPNADIGYFLLSNSAVAITELTFTSIVTPEPGSATLVLAAGVVLLVGEGLRRRRVRRSFGSE